MKKKMMLLVLMITVALFISACSGDQASSDSGEDYPSESETLDWTIAFGPGGGNDVMAREMIKIMEQYDLYPGDIVPENREGGSGAVGWGYMQQNVGDPYQISTTSGSFITTPLQSDPGWDYESFTHVALMATDDMFLVVPGNSDYETLDDFIAAAKDKKMNIGGIGVANVDRMIVETFGKEAELEYEYVSFNAEGQLQSAMLSNTLDAIVANPSGVIGQLESGDMRALAFSGVERLPDYADIPTFIESGYEVNISMPRGVILAGEVDEEVRQWWIDTMKKVAETDEWAEYISKNYLSETILYGDDFTEYLDETTSVFNDILSELGVIEE
ncbi:Bug family tripartite tricarboxylate transporter substrate binding protein [Oceanobacillus bengalensis]|uniref:Tripartite tricarboxylate transporter substrate binding protein n=1 Tax=Oceanobacillus bengalensis TaxID=1435466 RepID=A0A494YXB2_9BACI|nr:tripartite tricarboxylate transporter substrate-binding protein [Oceanobacillus bengalensis]RKQ14750.1 tripartite tricarboxylate transporter substrate binding protein [Oceanobacillus bengalensis]